MFPLCSDSELFLYTETFRHFTEPFEQRREPPQYSTTQYRKKEEEKKREFTVVTK